VTAAPARRRWLLSRGTGSGLSPAAPAGALALLLFAPLAAAGQAVREGYDLAGAELRELTLDEAVAVGLEENPDVRSARFRFAATRAGLWDAYGNFLPQLSLSAFLQKSGRGQFVLGGVPFEDFPPSFTTYYQFDLTHRLFDAGRDVFRVQGARAERRAADAEVEAERLGTAAEIKRQYVAALAAEALREQAAREIERRETRFQLAHARFELGAVTRSDELQARIGVSQAEVDEVRQQAEERTAKLELLQAMGVQAAPDSLALVEELAVFEPAFDADSLVRRALREHPRLVRLRALADLRSSEHWIAKAAYLPSLDAGASFTKSVSDTSEFLFSNFENRTTYFVNLRWELFGGFSGGGFARYNQTSRAKAELRAAEEAVRAVELEIEAGVRQAHLELLTAYRTQSMREEEVELARRDLDLAQERYRIGALSFVDLQDSQVTFSAAETDNIRAKYDFFRALANLEEASAQPLFPTGGAPATPSPTADGRPLPQRVRAG
jgi:outer membrane protein